MFCNKINGINYSGDDVRLQAELDKKNPTDLSVE